MDNLRKADDLFQQASLILFACSFPAKSGIWADPKRYKYTCWTRDTTLAIVPVHAQIGKDEDKLMRHFARLAELQYSNGQIPILHLDDEAAWVAMKEAEEKAEGKTPFMLRRYRAGQIGQLTPGTRDSEILFIKGVCELYFRKGKKLREWFKKLLPAIDRALNYVETSLLVDGLIKGCDWRDTMEIELGEATLLSNNSILFEVYRLLAYTRKDLRASYEKKAEALFDRMRAVFWKNGRLIDHPGSERGARVDPLGSALAVLSGFVNPTDYDAVVDGFRSIDTDYGVTIMCQHSAYTPDETEVIKRTGGMVVWPWIVGYTILAALRMHAHDFALEQFRKWLRHDGFAEWYDPATGKGYGAKEQLWSATLFMLASVELTKEFGDIES